jgi:hypothetical protein
VIGCWRRVEGSEADGGKELIFTSVHGSGLAGAEVVVALDVEERMEGVEEEFFAGGVAEVGGAAAGFIEAEDGVEFDGGPFGVEGSPGGFAGGEITHVEGEDVGGGGEIHGAGVEVGHGGVVDDGHGPGGFPDTEVFKDATEVGGEPTCVQARVGLVGDMESDGHGRNFTRLDGIGHGKEETLTVLIHRLSIFIVIG